MRICLLTEGSYPYVVGGVSAWCQMLMQGLPEHEFCVYSIGAEEKDRGQYRYQFPKNMTGIQEEFLDAILAHRARGRVRHVLTARDKKTLAQLVTGEGELSVQALAHIFRRPSRQLSFLELFMSDDFFDVIQQVYRTRYSHLPFTDFFWTIRSMLLPLFYLLQQKLPEADVYHSVATGYCGVIGALAVKRYKKLLLGYLSGVLLTAAVAVLLIGQPWLLPEQSGLLAMNCGLLLIDLVFFVQITQYFGLPRGGQMFAFLPYIERHWRLFLVSLCYMTALFIQNIIIWQGPWGVRVAETWTYVPVYDIVTFYAFLSILPTMMLFVVSVETLFYTAYAQYFHYILQKGDFRQIATARRKLLQVLWFELEHVAEYQLVVTLVCLALGNYLLSGTGLNYNQVTMYNVLIFAAFFTGLLQVFCVLLLYFDAQRGVLPVAVLYLGLNVVLGLLGLWYGGPVSYGFTFFAASLVAFLLSVRQLSDFSRHIDYFVYAGQPLFYRPPQGPLTRLTRWLYGDAYAEMEVTKGKTDYMH